MPGRKLTRDEQKKINGGTVQYACESSCVEDSDCSNGKKCKEIPCPQNPETVVLYCIVKQ